MSQNDWATILPFGPVTNFLLAQKKNFGPALISGPANYEKSTEKYVNEHNKYCN
jgi:hypothetical protein